jgi:gamma-glutamyltranspeptidase/glutathione hydrolase
MRVLFFLLFTTFILACASSSPRHIDFKSWKRNEDCCVAKGKNWAIASGGTLSSEAGKKVLESGGNIVDAAVATAFSLAVERPHSLGLGGGGFLMLSLRGKKPEQVFIDFRETAPAKANRNMYLDPHGKPISEKSQRGILSVATPGFVPGLFEIHRKWGKLPWKTVLAASIRLAEEGFPVYLSLAKAISEEESVLRQEKYITEIFYPKGKAIETGDLLLQKDLAKTLRRIAENPENEFRNGLTAQKIALFSKERKGILSLKDLQSYRVKSRKPLRYQYKGKELLLPPPPSAGGVLFIEMLNMLRNDSLNHLSESDYLNLLAKVLKRAYADRSKFIGDPDFSKLPIDSLLNPSHGEKLRKEIQTHLATPGSKENRHTSHLSILDSDGNGVSMTLTLNDHFGSRLAVPETGIFLNDEMDDFTSSPGTPNLFGLVGTETNAIQPGKRPASSMTPILALKEGRAVLSLGAAGGSRITSHVFQILLGLYERNRNSLRDALFQPRIHHQWLPDRLELEKGFSDETFEALGTFGHSVHTAIRTAIAQGVYRDSEDSLEAVFDPRDEGGVTAK